MLVVDASVLVTALVDDEDEDVARGRLAGQTMSAPDVIDLEIASVLRRELLAGRMNTRRVELAFADLIDPPLERVAHRNLPARCWELRENMTPYDASYVALAEALDRSLELLAPSRPAVNR